MKISQSMLRAYQDYLNEKECGLWFEAKYIKGEPVDREPTEAMKAGQWFEYVCTGSTPRNSGEVPEPVKLKSGELNAMYRALNGHVDMWRRIAPDKAEYGKVIENDKAIFGHTLTGITDVYTDELIGDIKTTSQIDNRWEEFGWGGDPEHLAEKTSMLQAKFYLAIEYLNSGRVLPFLFYVFSANSDKCKVVRVEMTRESIEKFISWVNWMVGMIDDGGFNAVPSYDRCRACPIADCSHRQTFPDVITVEL